MTNDELRMKAAADQMKSIGDPMVYENPAGHRTVNILIERNVQALGPNGSINEYAYVAAFTREAIDDPKRGEIIDNNSSRYRLERELPSADRYISIWSMNAI